MKKIIVALCLLVFAGTSVNAQKCSKKSKKACAATCAKKKAAMKTSETETKVLSAMAEADVAAEADENIQVRECAKSGAKSYYQKSVCSKSGKVAWNEVEFDKEKKEFTRVASASAENDVEKMVEDAIPSEAKTEKKTCSKAEKKACAKSGKKCSKKDAKACTKKKEMMKEEEEKIEKSEME